MSAVARLGDPSSHGGAIISASSNVLTNGIGTARQGDSHSCPDHGITGLTAITTKTYVNGQLVATVGCTAGCGAVIVSGSPDVNAE